MCDMEKKRDRTVFKFDHIDVVEERGDYVNHKAEFHGFLDMPLITDGEICIRLKKTVEGDEAHQLLPMYIYSILDQEGRDVGEISLRVGYNEEVYYGGNIGYAVEESHRGRGYAPRACLLIFRLARAHKMPMLAICNEYSNARSMRVCEKLGMRYMRTVELPEENDMRIRNPEHIYENIYFMEL